MHMIIHLTYRMFPSSCSFIKFLTVIEFLCVLMYAYICIYMFICVHTSTLLFQLLLCYNSTKIHLFYVLEIHVKCTFWGMTFPLSVRFICVFLCYFHSFLLLTKVSSCIYLLVNVYIYILGCLVLYILPRTFCMQDLISNDYFVVVFAGLLEWAGRP